MTLIAIERLQAILLFHRSFTLHYWFSIDAHRKSRHIFAFRYHIIIAMRKGDIYATGRAYIRIDASLSLKGHLVMIIFILIILFKVTTLAISL